MSADSRVEKSRLLCSWSLLTVAAVASAVALTAAGCAATPSGIDGYEAFIRDARAGTFTYRLQVNGPWFERVRIAAAGTGSRAELRVAPNLDAQWRSQFERDRAAPSVTCLGA